MRLRASGQTIQRARELRTSMSKPERLLWWSLRKQKARLRFRKQHPAGPYVLDFYCDAVKLCVEVDDLSHDFRVSRDAARDKWLAGQGVRTLRVPATEVLGNLQGVVDHIIAEAQTPSVTQARDTSP